MTTISKKVCLLGDFAVGKTSLVRRFVYNRFDDKYISTIGVKVSRKTVSIAKSDDIVELTMMLWDLAGSEEFDQVRSSYLRGSAGAVLVCDLTRAETLTNLQNYADDLLKINSDVKMIIAANKFDLTDQHAFGTAEVEEVAQSLGISFSLTSAKESNEVDEIFRNLGQLLIA
jgi:small GTP-binding protein